MLKALDISSVTARVAPDMLKALAIVSDKTVTRSAVGRKDLKLYWKSGKKSHISLGDQQASSYKFFKDFTNHRRRLSGQ